MTTSTPASPLNSDEDNDMTIVSNEISVCTPSGSGSGSPLRKRPRYDDSDTTDHDDRMVKDKLVTGFVGDKPLVRDTTYYMVDGSCVLLVEDTLFNVRALFHLPRMTDSLGICIYRYRCIERCYLETRHRLVGCFRYRKGATQKKVLRTIILSY